MAEVADPEPRPPAAVGDVAGSAPPAVLAALLESLADAVYFVDREGTIRYVNAAALEILGHREDELLGRSSHATIHHTRPGGVPYPEEQCSLLRPRTTGETVRVAEDWFVRRDGTLVPVSCSSAPFPTPDGRGAVVVFRDISAQREAEAAGRREAAERARAQELARSRARIVEAGDEARRRIGRDLHDGAQQRLMNGTLAVRQALDRLDAGRLDDARRELEAALEELRGTLGDLRELAAGIHPTILTHRGLGAAIDALVARAPIPVRATVPGERFPEPIEVAAYYVVAEALANAAKHAGATALEVEVRVEPGALRVRVRDDGRGGARVGEGTGLQGLADRVAALGGRLSVAEAPGGGTTVEATLPLPDERQRGADPAPLASGAHQRDDAGT